MSRDSDILLSRRMFGREVDRILGEVEKSKDDPVRFAYAQEHAQQEFNRLDRWFHKHVIQESNHRG